MQAFSVMIEKNLKLREFECEQEAVGSIKDGGANKKGYLGPIYTAQRVLGFA